MDIFLLTLLAFPGHLCPQDAETIFDGKTLQGWETSDPQIWRVENGALVGGDLQTKIAENSFLFSNKEYADFELRLQFRLEGVPGQGMINSGVQFRSKRLKNGHAAGYQADLGDPSWWGALYDENRRNRVLAASEANPVDLRLRSGKWNDYVIRCEGPEIKLWINGVATVDYTEPDSGIPRAGKIGFQVHSGGPVQASFRGITIQTLPSSESGLTPEEELASFQVPHGFVVELVASEETGLPKPITIQFDDAGRMWSMTATEYPMDANESPEAAAELWEKGGRDQVVVIDKPCDPGPHRARTFLEGLAMPMGLLPWKNGVILGHGSDVIFIEDRNGDGTADHRQVLLSGFGVQDSHLMPHQFTFMPNGWIAMAQGAFNSSQVVAGKNAPVTFNYCKLGRFRPDGSKFEIIGYGFNNIWGLALGREGETFIQEANDMNYSVVPFQNYSTYPGIGNEKFRPYAPIAAPITDFFLGGTGLSGLALFESRSGSFPSSWDSVMFVANPITGTIHAVKIGETEGGGYSTTRLANFLTSSDEQFRPIALQFGPDGCLYIVDWYNKIISHNEVSREHPARDKSRGRVWRVRHESQTRRDIPDLTKVPDLALVEYLKSDSTWEMRAAWRQIMFRQPRHLAPALAQLAQDESQRADARIHALWSLKSLGEVNAKISLDMLRSPNRNIRREALRVQDGWLESSMVDDPDPQVRAEAIRSLLRQENFTQDHMFELIRFAKPSLGVAPVADIPWAGRHGTPVPAGPLYDREFERFLVRMGLERQPASLVQFLESRRAGQLDPESRLFASLALPSDQVVGHFLRAWQDVDRLPNEEELVLLLRGRSDRKLMPLMEELFSDPKRSPGLMRAALGLRDRLEQSGLEDVFTPALLRLSRSQGQEDLLVDMVAAFQLKKLRKPVAKVLANSRHDLSLRIAALQALRRIGAGADQAVLACLDPSTTPQGLRLSALVAVGASGSAQHFSRVIKAITKLSQVELEGVVDELSRTVAGANLLLSGILEAQIPESLLASNAWERMSELLPNNREMQEIWAQKAKSLPQALQLDGSPGQYSATQLSLSGPFTVEAWVRLEEGIDNADGLLGRPGGADLNFHDARARFYGGPALGDLVIAKRRMTPEIWTHVALSRDRSGIFRIYLDGELDAVGKNKNTSDFQYLDIGRTSPTQAGTAGALMEFRLWSHARSADAIRTFFRHKLSVREEGLVLSFPWGGDPRSLEGGAHVVPISQSPRLLDEVAAAKQEQELARYRGMIEKPGDVNRGASLFQGLCLSCHTVGGKGAGVAPALDGTSHRDLDSLLRAVVFPNAAFEPGYRTYRLETYSGEIYEGFFVGKDELGTTIGFMGGTQVFVEAKDIRRARFLDRSFMLAGILDGLDDQRVADLFAMIATIP